MVKSTIKETKLKDFKTDDIPEDFDFDDQENSIPSNIPEELQEERDSISVTSSEAQHRFAEKIAGLLSDIAPSAKRPKLNANTPAKVKKESERAYQQAKKERDLLTNLLAGLTSKNQASSPKKSKSKARAIKEQISLEYQDTESIHTDLEIEDSIAEDIPDEEIQDYAYDGDSFEQMSHDSSHEGDDTKSTIAAIMKGIEAPIAGIVSD